MESPIADGQRERQGVAGDRGAAAPKEVENCAEVIDVWASRIDDAHFYFICPYCVSELKEDGTRGVGAQRVEHQHGSGGDLSNRTEERTRHCISYNCPASQLQQKYSFRIHITDATERKSRVSKLIVFRGPGVDAKPLMEDITAHAEREQFILTLEPSLQDCSYAREQPWNSLLKKTRLEKSDRCCYMFVLSIANLENDECKKSVGRIIYDFRLKKTQYLIVIIDPQSSARHLLEQYLSMNAIQQRGSSKREFVLILTSKLHNDNGEAGCELWDTLRVLRGERPIQPNPISCFAVKNLPNGFGCPTPSCSFIAPTFEAVEKHIVQSHSVELSSSNRADFAIFLSNNQIADTVVARQHFSNGRRQQCVLTSLDDQVRQTFLCKGVPCKFCGKELENIVPHIARYCKQLQRTETTTQTPCRVDCAIQRILASITVEQLMSATGAATLTAVELKQNLNEKPRDPLLESRISQKAHRIAVRPVAFERLAALGAPQCPLCDDFKPGFFSALFADDGGLAAHVKDKHEPEIKDALSQVVSERRFVRNIKFIFEDESLRFLQWTDSMESHRGSVQESTLRRRSKATQLPSSGNEVIGCTQHALRSARFDQKQLVLTFVACGILCASGREIVMNEMLL